MSDFRLWLEDLEDVVRRVAAILSPDQKPTKKVMAQAREIVATDPGKKDNKLASVALAKWVKKGYGLKEHIRDVANYYNLRMEFRKLRRTLEKSAVLEIAKLLPRNLDDFDEPSRLQAINQKVNALMGKKTEMTGLDKLEVVGREDDYVMYRVPPKGEVPGFHPDQIPAFKDCQWCVLGEYYGQYGGGPYYPILKGGKTWFGIIIPAIIPENMDEGIRAASNDRRLSLSELSRIKGLLQKVVPVEKILELVKQNNNYLPLLYFYPGGVEMAKKVVGRFPSWMG